MARRSVLLALAIVDGLRIQVGAPWAGCELTVIIDADHATVFHHTRLVRYLRLDRSRRYQPNRKPRGGPRQPRHLPS